MGVRSTERRLPFHLNTFQVYSPYVSVLLQFNFVKVLHKLQILIMLFTFYAAHIWVEITQIISSHSLHTNTHTLTSRNEVA